MQVLLVNKTKQTMIAVNPAHRSASNSRNQTFNTGQAGSREPYCYVTLLPPSASVHPSYILGKISMISQIPTVSKMFSEDWNSAVLRLEGSAEELIKRMVLAKQFLCCHPPGCWQLLPLPSPAYKGECSGKLDSCFQTASMTRTHVMFSMFGTIAHWVFITHWKRTI